MWLADPVTVAPIQTIAANLNHLTDALSAAHPALVNQLFAMAWINFFMGVTLFVLAAILGYQWSFKWTNQELDHGTLLMQTFVARLVSLVAVAFALVFFLSTLYRLIQAEVAPDLYLYHVLWVNGSGN